MEHKSSVQKQNTTVIMVVKRIIIFHIVSQEFAVIFLRHSGYSHLYLDEDKYFY